MSAPPLNDSSDAVGDVGPESREADRPTTTAPRPQAAAAIAKMTHPPPLLPDCISNPSDPAFRPEVDSWINDVSPYPGWIPQAATRAAFPSAF
jgi:hypothetical protein